MILSAKYYKFLIKSSFALLLGIKIFYEGYCLFLFFFEQGGSLFLVNV